VTISPVQSSPIKRLTRRVIVVNAVQNLRVRILKSGKKRRRFNSHWLIGGVADGLNNMGRSRRNSAVTTWRNYFEHFPADGFGRIKCARFPWTLGPRPNSVDNRRRLNVINVRNFLVRRRRSRVPIFVSVRKLSPFPPREITDGGAALVFEIRS